MASNITRLPKEVLSKIFDNLTKANDRRRAAQICKLFYAVLRDQPWLKQDNTLRLTDSDLEASPIRAFENSEFFPFSKLSINNWHQNVVLESAFWSLHGSKVRELIIFSLGPSDDTIESFLYLLRDYFPNLKKLTIESMFSKFSDDGHNSQTISLPIQDLTMNIWTIPSEQIVTLIRCSPLLKNLQITCYNNQLTQILPWLETIESSRLSFGEIQLKKLINLPSNVVIDKLTIKVDETPESIREFFKRSRTIDQLFLHPRYYNENNQAHVYFTRDQAMALRGAKSIKKVRLPLGVLEFEGSLDFLAELPGVESISLKITESLSNPLYPFYWSSPETAKKIRKVKNMCDNMRFSNLDYLADLSSLTSLELYQELSSDEIQTLIRNCPNLKKLFVDEIDATDAELIGHGDLLSISTLQNLESLRIGLASNITLEAFKSAFKFSNLKCFELGIHIPYKGQNKGQPFDKNVAKLFTQNCPNLERLEIYDCPITEKGFDFLIRHLPYLQSIYIEDKRHPMRKNIVEKIQQEFPYIVITFYG